MFVTVTDWAEQLRQVQEMNRAVQPGVAEETLVRALEGMPFASLRQLEPEIDSAVQSFLPKRRAKLQRLREALQSRVDGSKEEGPNSQSVVESELEVDRSAVEMVGVYGGDSEPGASQDHASLDSIEESVAEVLELLHSVQPQIAETRTRAIIAMLSSDELRENEAALVALVDNFLPKRKRILSQVLNDRLAVISTNTVLNEPTDVHENKMPRLGEVSLTDHAGEATSPSRIPHGEQSIVGASDWTSSRSSTAPSRVAVTHDRFQTDLDELSQYHIFQWATYYRDTLAEYFDVFLDELAAAESSQPLDIVRSCLYSHSREIFRKGYLHVTGSGGDDSSYGLTKSLAGLQRFLDLPLEFYSSSLQAQNRHPRQLRKLCSAMLCGILQGYASAQLGQSGGQVLPRYQRSWAHTLPFLTTADLDELTPALESGDFVDGVNGSVRPLVSALDQFADQEPNAAPMPALSQYLFSTRRLDVSLLLPPKQGSRTLDVQCYTSIQFVSADALEEASARATDVVIAPLRSDLRARVESIERWSSRVVPVLGRDEVDPSKRLLSRLEDLVHQSAETSLSRVISFNYAATFPLENPFLTKYNHVYRSSVRRLMQSHDRRNGVRLWCSVRRSGKTTACMTDLGATSGQSVFVSQTCESTGQIPHGDVFYREVRNALDKGRRLDDEFVMRAIQKCLPSASTADTRIVLVLDEYETLFGDLKSSLGPRPDLRYSVVQPLLNQLVAFARDNLLVLMGQQPNAHFILLDQNQLSPVVEQDSFPLFPHDPAVPQLGEFYELMGRVMTAHVKMDPEFVNAVYRETSGHPFLTVKLMLTFMDWLIRKQRLMSDLAPIRAELLQECLAEELQLSRIARNHHFTFFRNAAAEHLSMQGRQTEPWLGSVYGSLRLIGLSSPETLSVTLNDFTQSVERAGGAFSPDDLLASASRANFLSITDDEYIHPQIPLLARIAASVTPR